MKKKITFLFLLLMLGTTAGWAQYRFYISAFQNDGVEPTGTNNYLRAPNSDVGVGSLSLGMNTNGVGGDGNSFLRSQWVFIPVAPAPDAAAEVGWYYIQNVYATGYVLCAPESSGGDITLSNDLTGMGDRAKWRLIKVNGGNIPDRSMINYFKLVSKQGSTSTNGGGTVINAAEPYHIIQGSTDYTATNSVFQLTFAEDNLIVLNDDMEVVTTEVPVSGTTLDGNKEYEFRNPGGNTYGSNTVWLNLPCSPVYNDTWNETDGAINAYNENYILAPYGFAQKRITNGGSTPEVTLIYSNYASGGLPEDGYYFARIDNGSAIYQGLPEISTTGRDVEIAFWLRASTPALTSLTPTIAGMYKVGKVVVSYDSGSNTELDILVSENAITDDPGAKNDPDYWNYFTTYISAETNDGRNVAAIEIQAEVQTLDVDNLQLSLRQSVGYDGVFHYKLSGGVQQARQSVHEMRQVIYTQPGQTERLQSATATYHYYRWYNLQNNQERSFLPNTGLVIPGTTSRYLVGDLTISPSALSTGDYAQYTIPADFDFEDPDVSTIYCDMSNYTDGSQTGSQGSYLLKEPTLSLRSVFEFRDGQTIADAIENATGAGSVYEYYEIDVPIGRQFRMAPEYTLRNYWRNDGSGGLERADHFRWFNLGGSPSYAPGTGTIITDITSDYSFPTDEVTNTRRFLQFSTAGKGHGTFEYFAVDMGRSGSYDAISMERIAIFKLNYRNDIGPKIGDPGDPETDIFAHIENKKNIITKTFDQLGSTPNPLPDGFTNKQEFTVYGMGSMPLKVDESTYGFTNPLYFTPDATGEHGHHRAPYWSEYGFPRAINSGVTNDFSWSNGGANVKDITYLKQSGVLANSASSMNSSYTAGNMLYVDAAQFPGTIAALDFSESMCPQARLYFSTWIVDLNASTTVTRPNLTFILKTINDGGTETIVKRFSTGNIAVDATGGNHQPNTWYQVGFDFLIPETAGSAVTQFHLEIVNNGLNTEGNDFAIDHIEVFRTNPAITALRTNELYCLPDGSVAESNPLTMQVAVDLEQLELSIDSEEANHILYYRFLGDKAGKFPEFKDDGDLVPMYVNGDVYCGGGPGPYDEDDPTHYYYGSIDLSAFTKTPTTQDELDLVGDKLSTAKVSSDTKYAGMFLYYTTIDSKNIYTIVFSQDIPALVLNGQNPGEFNLGTYWAYVGEGPGALLGEKCAGVADFEVQFDDTDFDLTAMGIEVEAGMVLPICTNRAVNIKAYATDQRDDNAKLFAYYDWFMGPLDTEPSIAGDYEYSFEGTYSGTAYGETKTVNDAPVRNKDGFSAWLGSPDGIAWTGTHDGGSWAWSEPNYVGYNTYGGYFRYIISGVSYQLIDINTTPPTLGSVIDNPDGVTSATRIGDTDNRNTWDTQGNGGTGELKPVDFRTLRLDMKAYRFFYPYEPNLPKANQTEFPVNPNSALVKTIDYRTGEYFDASDNLITDATAGVNAARFSATSCPITMIDFNGVVSSTPYVGSLEDLNFLLARMNYWERIGLVQLYKDNIDVDVETLAPIHITVIPSDIAFRVDNINTDFPNIDNPKAICVTPKSVLLQAKDWAPDSWLGEVTSLGFPAMPYLDIKDEDYVYTVRLPEKKDLPGTELGKKERVLTTEQFVLPLLYLDEVKNARIKLVAVTDEKGEAISVANNLYLNNPYIGLIDPENPNRLLRNVTIDYQYSYPDFNNPNSNNKDTYTGSQNIRWKLNLRDQYHALEAYPLIYNGYNLFIDDPVPGHDVIREGDPLPAAVIKTLISGVSETNEIALEILASDLDNNSYTKLVEGVRHFIPGYTYEFALEATGFKTWDATSECDLNLPFLLKVVPDVIIWGADEHDYEWNLDANWYYPEKDGENYTDQKSAYTTFPPLPETHVIIPSDLSKYSILEDYSNLPEEFLSGAGGATEQTYYNTSKKIISMELFSEDFHRPYYIEKEPSEYTVTPFIEFDYNYVPNFCNTIHFKHGMSHSLTAESLPETGNAELGAQHLLNYSSAKVDLSLRTMRWYGLSAPLHNMYSGDYAFYRLNPLVETRLFNTDSPQTGANSITWTQPFNNANIELTAGMGYSVSSGRLYYPDLTDTDFENDLFTLGSSINLANASYTFPGEKMEFQFFHELTRKRTDRIDYLADVYPAGDGRKYSGRFVYEEKLGTANEYDDKYGRGKIITSVPEDDVLVTIPVKLQANTDNSLQVIGNPLMSHLDFEKFYAANYAVIEPKMQILHPTGSSYISITGIDADNSGKITGVVETPDGLLTFRSIPPMQTFIVSLRAGAQPTDELVITKDMGVVYPPSRLRSTSTASNQLRVKVTGLYDMSTSAVVQIGGQTNSKFYSPEDNRRLLNPDYPSTPNVFTISDGMYLDINRLPEFPMSLPIGIYGGAKGAAKLTLSGFLSLEEYLDFYLLDTQKERKIPIANKDEFEYEFEYDGKESLGRFYLIASGALTSIDKPDGTLSIFGSNRMIEVLSLDGSELKEVSVYTLNGVLLHKSVNTGKTRLSIPHPAQNPVVIVRAVTDTATLGEKIVNK